MSSLIVLDNRKKSGSDVSPPSAYVGPLLLAFGVKKAHGLHVLEAKPRAEIDAQAHDVLRKAVLLPHQRPATNSRAELSIRDRLEDRCFAFSLMQADDASDDEPLALLFGRRDVVAMELVQQRANPRLGNVSRKMSATPGVSG